MIGHLSKTSGIEMATSVQRQLQQEKRMESFWQYAFANKEIFDFHGNLKNWYRNKPCRCNSGEKMKYCHGIKYENKEYEELFCQKKKELLVSHRFKKSN